MKYKLEENKFGKYFIKNHKYYYLDEFDIWGLDRTIWHDKIDYVFYKVRFIIENGIEYIQLSKNKKTRELERVWR